MELRPLGATGISVSLLGLGTVKLGRTHDLRYPQPFELPTDLQTSALLLQAQHAGINFIDTAPAYGVSEARIGALLPGARHDWIVSTKVGEEFVAESSRQSVHRATHHDFSATHTRASVARSLARLRCDYLDVVLMHCADDDLHNMQHSDCLATLLALKQQGTIRAYGASTKTLAGTQYALRHCDVVMMSATAGPMATRDIADCIAVAAQHNCGLLIKKALQSGHASAAIMRERVRELAEQSSVSCIVIGTLNPTHLLEHCASLVA